MFPQFKRLKNESGLVLYLVLMTAIIVMILSVSILTQSMNETNYAQQQIDQIISDQLAKGIFWNEYSSSFAAGQVTNMSNVGISTVMQGRSYQVSVNYQGVGGGCPTCTTWGATANFDSL